MIVVATTHPATPPSHRTPFKLARMDQRLEEANERNDVDLRFAEVNQRIDRHTNEVNARIDELKKVTIKGYIKLIRLDNALYQLPGSLEEVPFPDGTFPWGKEVEVDGPSHTRVKLPELRNLESVKNLTEPETFGYFQGYYPGEQMPPQTARRREKILLAIGLGKDLHLL
ncbi:hypothetical protein GSI_05703 [Ganoderma sinense ZZ0214-1]|uniref:Mug135-like C-terminal domain-containing protein n=1 Tax=Ganoderma sinense ZZ0214-1 TaxID=1077348 RepID=A0A2G8SB78_9APHY|nr:hypothetical protein GSI_05703 [Ganoderma sinense ZZ0214-1]